MKNLKKLEKKLYFKILIPITIFVIAIAGWITFFEAIHIQNREAKLETKYDSIIDTDREIIYVEDSLNFKLQQELQTKDSIQLK